MTLLLDLPGLRAREAAEPGFSAALAALGSRLQLNPSFIGAVMSLESGIKPDAVNPSGGATGLIQFMPATATGLGTSAAALKTMTGIQQLKYVEAYFARVARAIREEVPGDYYMATFLPAFIGKPASTVLATKGEPIYDQNKGLDANGDGTLTVADVTAKIDSIVASANARPMFEATDVVPTPEPAEASATGGGFDALLGLALAVALAVGTKWATEILGAPKK